MIVVNKYHVIGIFIVPLAIVLVVNEALVVRVMKLCLPEKWVFAWWIDIVGDLPFDNSDVFPKKTAKV